MDKARHNELLNAKEAYKKILYAVSKPSDARDKKYLKEHKDPIRLHDVIEMLYKKQLPDLPNHVEMVEKMEEKKRKPKAVVKEEVKEEIKGGSLIVEGSIPVHSIPKDAMQINSTVGMLQASGQPKKEKKEMSDAMKRRSQKIKEIMAKEKVNMIQASKIIKERNIKY